MTTFLFVVLLWCANQWQEGEADDESQVMEISSIQRIQQLKEIASLTSEIHQVSLISTDVIYIQGNLDVHKSTCKWLVGGSGIHNIFGAFFFSFPNLLTLLSGCLHGSGHLFHA